MKKNYMEQVAQILGVEMGEKFKLERDNGEVVCDECYISSAGLMCRDVNSKTKLGILLTGCYNLIKKPWCPEKDETYYIPTVDGFYESKYNSTEAVMLRAYRNGFVFKTKEEAIEKAKELGWA